MALRHLSFALLISLSFGLPGDGEEYREIQQEIERISRDREIGNYFNRVQDQVGGSVIYWDKIINVQF